MVVVTFVQISIIQHQINGVGNSVGTEMNVLQKSTCIHASNIVLVSNTRGVGQDIQQSRAAATQQYRISINGPQKDNTTGCFCWIGYVNSRKLNYDNNRAYQARRRRYLMFCSAVDMNLYGFSSSGKLWLYKISNQF